MSKLAELLEAVLASDDPPCGADLARELLRTDSVGGEVPPTPEEPDAPPSAPGSAVPLPDLPEEAVDGGSGGTDAPAEGANDASRENEEPAAASKDGISAEAASPPPAPLALDPASLRALVAAFDDAYAQHRGEHLAALGGTADVEVSTRPLHGFLARMLVDARSRTRTALPPLPVLEGMPPEREEAAKLREDAAKLADGFLDALEPLDPSFLDPAADPPDNPGISTPTFPPAALDAARRFLALLTPQSLLLLLAHRLTTGSTSTALPPSLPSLLAAFLAPHVTARPHKSPRPASQLLTSGCVALSKHSQRSLSGAWGQCTGPVPQRNAAAARVLARVLGRAAWANAHGLPHGVVAYEVRDGEGYGARWTVDEGGGVRFRGFLEPPMEDGHGRGWVH
ncbi:hypothetical protein DFJ74DRAFT_372608 [Hyaloraphidium curvatum]|nr:hypothetical protein DFJ74DRAFT_372608 [Hyaloraphidium curvatum]